MSVPVELEFPLRLLFSWEPEHAQLYKCVTALGPKKSDGKRPAYNNAVKTFDDMVRLIEARKNWPHYDTYFALGEFRLADTKRSPDGFLNIERSQKNAVHLKCLFIDIDAKDYADDPVVVEAALQAFLKSSGMPAPSLVVRSGSGGMHVYWVFDQPLDVDTWKPLAEALKKCCEHHGLKIDEKVTADAARILRIPTTLNHKHNPPVPVTIDVPLTTGQQYSELALTGILAQFIGARKAVTKTGTGSAIVASPWSQNFMAGLDERVLPKLSIDQIAVNCPMTAQTLADGGAGKSEPDWNNDIYLSAWMDNPTDAAHRLSCGHAEYDPVETDRKLAEKQKAITNGGLGWPRCASFNHPACKTCPLLSQGKSPIHFGHRTIPLQPATVNDPLMPEGYWRNVNNQVLAMGANGACLVLESYPVLDGGIDPVTGELVLKTVISGRERWGALAPSKQTGPGMCEALAKGTKNGILIRGDQKAVKAFIMAWMTHLQQIKKFVQPNGFGWSGNNFVFGDEIYTPAGPDSTYRGSTDDPTYQRVGELDPWINSMVLAYGNPAMEVLVASSFAAPLVTLTCDYSLTLSVFSEQSGFGKSTSMKIAQAVWGHPTLGMSILDDTENSVDTKTATLKHLPIYWDEMKTEEQAEKLVRVVFKNAQGKSKSRLDRNSEQKKTTMSRTMLVVASNLSIAERVYNNTETTEAGGLRVFEIESLPLSSSIAASKSETLILKLNDNYGCAGAVYADFIARNRPAIEQIIAQISDDLEKAWHFGIKERFWKNTMVTILAGANLANAAGLTTFNIQAIETCLIKSLEDLRINLSNQPHTLAGAQAGEGVLGELIASLQGKSVIHTNIIPLSTMGRPASGTVKAMAFTDPGKLSDVWMQVGNDGRILIARKSFRHWLKSRNYQSELHIIKLLSQDYIIVQSKATIGAGLEFMEVLKARVYCWDMTRRVPLPPSHTPSSPSSSFGSLVQ